MSSVNYAKGVVYAVLSSATFGLIPLFSIPLLSIGLSSQTIICYRFLFATVIMVCVVILTDRDIKLRLNQLFVISLLSILYALTSILLLESYQVMPSGIATTIHFLYPLVVTLIMSWFFGERTTGVVYLAIALSLGGVMLLAWGNHKDGDFHRGVALAISTVITYALYIIGVMKSSARKVDPIVLTLYVLGMGTIIFFIYAFATTGIEPIGNFVAWRDMIMLALVCTVISDFTLVLAIKYIGSTMTSILGSMEPLTAVIIGVVYFGEHFDISSIAGVILIILAVVLVIVQGGRNRVLEEQ